VTLLFVFEVPGKSVVESGVFIEDLFVDLGLAFFFAVV